MLVLLYYFVISKRKEGMNQEYPKSSTENGVFYFDPNDIVIADSFKRGEVWEKNMIQSVLPIISNCKTVIDLGANIGSHSISYGNHNKNCKIYAFEPQKQLYEILKLNISENKLDNTVIPINKAVGYKQDTLKLQKIPTNEFNKGSIGFGNDGEEVEVITLDSLNLESCDFIKMDIQGAEPLALLGGEKTIKKFKPKILFEYDGSHINPKDVGMEKVPDTKELLESYGYTITPNEAGDFIALPI